MILGALSLVENLTSEIVSSSEAMSNIVADIVKIDELSHSNKTSIKTGEASVKKLEQVSSSLDGELSKYITH